MANDGDAHSLWLPVIGKALAYLCLHLAQKEEPKNLDTLLKRVKFLEGLGLSRADAAEAAGSSADSVRVLQERKRRAKNGRPKKKSRS